MKLALMVYILSQGGSTTRAVMLSIGALLVFLFQTGRLRITMYHHRAQPVQAAQPQVQPQVQPQQQQQQQAEGNNDGQNNENNVANNAQQQQPPPQQPPRPAGFFGEIRYGFVSNAPPRVGNMADVVCFCISGLVLPFFYSLLPTWTPTGVPVPPQPVDEGMQWN
jgi:hypothetical protein